MKLEDHLQKQIDIIETLMCPGLSEETESALAQAVLSMERHRKQILMERAIEESLICIQ